MKNKLNVKRMLELEKILENYDLKNNFTIAELSYLERANKMPLKYMIEFINIYKKNWLFIDEVEVYNTIKNLFNCSDEEIYYRFKEVHMILRYQDSKLNNLVKERKKLVKSLY